MHMQNTQFLHTLEKIPKNTSLIIAVSGWVDSMVLLDLCLSSFTKSQIYVVHINHSIRGSESDEDEDFIANFCNRESIQFFTQKYDIPALAKQEKNSVEATARKYRYKFFEEVSRKIWGETLLLTAHHLDDRIETLIFNLVRGTTLDWLVALREQGTYISENQEPLRFYRPFFHISKKDILEYAKVRNIKYREDSTNSNDSYLRNHIRNNIMQNFAKINPEYRGSIDAFMEYIWDLLYEQNTMTKFWLETQNEKSKKQFSKYENSQYIFSKKDFLKESEFLQKQIFAFIYKEKNNSSHGLSRGLIDELWRFIRDKNSYGTKEIKNFVIERRGEWIVVKN